ncbi:hypothetical protein V7138_12540 [Bacillus sp. JJ1533]|uniref:hypothetical protein n=1 Tax=Bacillus sp. JJ1533 TaxID=3122959 RepID=UPI003000EB49
MVFIIKPIQFICLFFAMMFYIDVLEQIYQGNLTSGFIMLVILLLATIFILKWISKYPTAFFGMFFVNGMLSLISFMVILYIFFFITGTRSFGDGMSLTMLFVGMLPIIFWWNFNILEVFRKKERS